MVVVVGGGDGASGVAGGVVGGVGFGEGEVAGVGDGAAAAPPFPLLDKPYDRQALLAAIAALDAPCAAAATVDDGGAVLSGATAAARMGAVE